MTDVDFRTATEEDWPAIWPIFEAVVRAGDTYTYSADIDEVGARSLWLKPGVGRAFTYVAEMDGGVVATAYVKPNQDGPGDHICNAGWMVAPEASGRGVGRRFAEWVIGQARDLGYHGMQFNSVVATNTRAVGLWESMGFEIVGTVPDGFRHPTEGLVPFHVMFRRL